MTRLALIRHAPTAWNRQRRLQGRAEVPLEAETEARYAMLAVRDDFRNAAWHSSPLTRAQATAKLLGADDVFLEPRLIEMDFGSFEGRTVKALREELGAEMTDNEARGLDFQPPGGESPRQVITRLRPWLEDCAAAGGDYIAVTHKGVIRACLAIALGWDMRDKQPVKLDWSAMHVFRLAPDGALLPLEMNVPLVSK